MKRVLRVTKTTRVLKIKDILHDLLSNVTDEELSQRHNLRWEQLEKVYAKLYYSGYLGKEDLQRRIDLRGGKDIGHIPFSEIENSGTVYECTMCGFLSPLHFSTCPRCREVNLRRLTKRILPPSAAESVSRPASKKSPDAIQNAAREAEYVFDHMSYWGNYL
jgi:hypothetical protein